MSAESERLIRGPRPGERPGGLGLTRMDFVADGDAAAVVDRARDVTSMTSGQAQAWIRAATATMEGLGAVRETDQDLHKVAARITGPDAQAVAARAWPRDAMEQQQALKDLKRWHGSFIRAAALPDPQQAPSRNPAVPERHPHRGKPGRSRGMER